MPSAKVDTRYITKSFVYDNPTIAQLTSFVCSTVLGSDNGPHSTTAWIEAMREMVAEYNCNFSAHRADPGVKRPQGDVVLVTGTKGSVTCSRS